MRSTWCVACPPPPPRAAARRRDAAVTDVCCVCWVARASQIKGEIQQYDTTCASYVDAFEKIMQQLGVPDIDSMVAHVIHEEAIM